MKPGVGLLGWLVVGALFAGCEEGATPHEAGVDAGADAGSCPDYKPNDAGVIQLMRGCPLKLDYRIQ